eukprot:TRINITY_DN5402_c0_g1_i1.p1 TRINITY_DN5402_c0_g1~~TRINITY_DN5402_c0_g1_i1.p1  ORF type:complete len:429 (-),score=89.55 TRINITY_DN5402_c0_g1_i1:94-1380(-)
MAMIQAEGSATIQPSLLAALDAAARGSLGATQLTQAAPGVAAHMLAGTGMAFGVPPLPGASPIPSLGSPGASLLHGAPPIPGTPSILGVASLPGALQIPGGSIPGAPPIPGVPQIPGAPMFGALHIPGLPPVNGDTSVLGAPMPGMPGFFGTGLPSVPGVHGSSPGTLLTAAPGGLQSALVSLAGQNFSHLLAQQLPQGLGASGSTNPIAIVVSTPSQSIGATPGVPLKPAAVPEIELMDADVEELCEHFGIQDHHAKRLNTIMKARKDTFEDDIAYLWEIIERAREPAGLLTVKMKEMEEGRFVGRLKADGQLKALIKKFKLDSEAENKLANIFGRQKDPDKKAVYLQEIESHLETSNKPSAMVMMLLKKIGFGEPLGKPGKPAVGSYLHKQEQEKERQQKGSDKDRDTWFSASRVAKQCLMYLCTY